ncbi:unnamed protein product [Rhizophagus irregularis]|uniref:Uncharacterized protein n=1 Tax=Rhizophagus irregularis TaxID=588596 RepID=A0A915YZB3_9GLOM|nr:unnamed protein product [Rhizophagus irregularis]CAB5353528.1 unnamed protein product [Rhizophagus irregularis]
MALSLQILQRFQIGECTVRCIELDDAMTMGDEDGSQIYMIRNLKVSFTIWITFTNVCTFEIVSPNILEVRNSSFFGGGHHLIDGPILLQDSDDSNEQHGF